MDLATRLASLAIAIESGNTPIPSEVEDCTRRSVFDACCCLVSGAQFLPAQVRAALDEAVPSSLDDEPSANQGSSSRVMLGDRAMRDATLVRALDANDTYVPAPGGSFGHFSEIIPLALRIAILQKEPQPVLQLLRAVAAAYEVMGEVLQFTRLESHGLHPASVTGLGSATLFGLFEGMDTPTLANNLRLAWTMGSIPNTWLGASNAAIGEFKTLAPGWSALAGIKAGDLSSAGITLPDGALEISGLVADPANDGDKVSTPTPSWRIMQMAHKLRPVQIHLQTVAGLGMELHQQGLEISDLKSITLSGHARMTGGVQGSKAAFTPRSASEADHSCPFVLISAIAHGELLPALFHGNSWEDEVIKAAMGKVTLVVDPTANRLFEEDRVWCARARITTMSGSTREVEVTDFAGSPQKPASWTELEQKFVRFTAAESSPRIRDAIRSLRMLCEVSVEAESADFAEDVWAGVRTLTGLVLH